MFAFKISRRVAAVVRGRSAYHFRPFNTTSYIYKGAGDSNVIAKLKLPTEDSIAKQAIELRQKDYKRQLDHLTEKVDQGFKSIMNDIKDGSKRTDRWMMLLVGVFTLKVGFDHANSAGVFGKKFEKN